MKVFFHVIKNRIQDEKHTLNLLKRTLQAINNTLTMFFDAEKSRKNDPLELCEPRLKLMNTIKILAFPNKSECILHNIRVILGKAIYF